MKNYKNQLVCPYHKQPIAKIDRVSKRMLCALCEQETNQQYKNRIQVMRAKVNTTFLQQLNRLKNIKAEVEKISQIFLNHNMVDAKRKIKKELPTVQVLVDSLLDRQIEQANKALKTYIEKLLKPWNSLELKKFDISFIEFEKFYPELYEQIQSKKKELKQNISNKLKLQLSNFYCKLFDL